MYNYVVGYWSHEEVPKIVLMHEKKFTQKQFEDLVSDCFAKIYAKTPEKELITFYSILSEGIDTLKEEFGFVEPIITAKFNPFGWPYIKDTETWGNSDKHLEMIRKKIKKLEDGK